MGFGGAPEGADGKKHELSLWDAKTASFPDHRTDMQKMMSSYNIIFIIYDEVCGVACVCGTVSLRARATRGGRRGGGGGRRGSSREEDRRHSTRAVCRQRMMSTSWSTESVSERRNTVSAWLWRRDPRLRLSKALSPIQRLSFDANLQLSRRSGPFRSRSLNASEASPPNKAAQSSLNAVLYELRAVRCGRREFGGRGSQKPGGHGAWEERREE